MDVAEELSGTFKVPKALVALLAIITGILILFFPYILNVLIAFFLVAWGLLKAAELGSKSSPQEKTVSPIVGANPFLDDDTETSEDQA